MSDLSMLIVGVGGQGTLLASRILGTYASLKELDCKLSEVHGMAQRGGSVVTHVRIGEKVLSPIVGLGGADIILSFEKLEAARFIPYLKKNGIVIVNTQEILPMPVIVGSAKYPDNIFEIISERTDKIIEIPALEVAEKAGSSKSVNVVMLGALTKALSLDKDLMAEAVKSTVKEKFIEVNIRAYEGGYALG